MTFKEMLRRLKELDIDPRAFDLEGTQKDEAYCLERTRPGWVFFYRERGIRRSERTFSSEDVACRFFLEKISRDPTTRNRGFESNPSQAAEFCEGDAADVKPPRSTSGGGVKFDEIGYWSELKLEIIESYAQAYSTILSKQRLKHVYIDGYSGAGEHISKTTGDMVPGSPLNAVNLDPPFEEYYLIDLDGDKVEHLRSLVGDHGNIHVLKGDCNEVLLQRVFPNVKYEDYCRGLCLLDPYGLQLDWEVIAKAGEMKTLEIFLNFPIMDMNRNVLWRDKDGPTPEHRERMTRFWGDESWADAVYHEADQLNLFGAPDIEKQTNDAVVEAFRTRLKKVAGFEYVPPPVPMRNTKGAVVYYLFFASQNNTGDKIVTHIFKKYRDRRS